MCFSKYKNEAWYSSLEYTSSSSTSCFGDKKETGDFNYSSEAEDQKKEKKDRKEVDEDKEKEKCKETETKEKDREEELVTFFIFWGLVLIFK